MDGPDIDRFTMYLLRNITFKKVTIHFIFVFK